MKFENEHCISSQCRACQVLVPCCCCHRRRHGPSSCWFRGGGGINALTPEAGSHIGQGLYLYLRVHGRLGHLGPAQSHHQSCVRRRHGGAPLDRWEACFSQPPAVSLPPLLLLPACPAAVSVFGVQCACSLPTTRAVTKFVPCGRIFS